MDCSRYGSPKKCLADNGGEFPNPNFNSICENLNVHLLKTAAESPWQNGLCERNHAVVDRVSEKTIENNQQCHYEQLCHGLLTQKIAFKGGANSLLTN